MNMNEDKNSNVVSGWDSDTDIERKARYLKEELEVTLLEDDDSPWLMNEPESSPPARLEELMRCRGEELEVPLIEGDPSWLMNEPEVSPPIGVEKHTYCRGTRTVSWDGSGAELSEAIEEESLPCKGRKRNASFGVPQLVTLSPRRKKKRCKDSPKRPLSAYNIFFKNERPRVLRESAKVGFEELGKTIGKRWKELPDEERKVYVQMAEEERIRYKNLINEAKRKKREESKRVVSSLKGREHESRNHPVSPVSSTFTSPSRGSGLQTGMPIEQGGRLPVAFQASPSSVRNFPAPRMYPFLHQRERPQFWTTDSQQWQHDFAPRGSPPLPFPSGIITSGTIIPPGIIPPGTELVLPDSTGQKRKFRMQYSFHSMSRLAAQNLRESAFVVGQVQLPPKTQDVAMNKK